jgi:uncharacterized protein YdhG (YjbR/CyaY superfamily)
MVKKSRLKRPILEMPSDIKDLLIKEGLYESYLNRPAYQQNDYIGWILRAKREETRQKRIDQMTDELKAGNVYMKMAYGEKNAKSGPPEAAPQGVDPIDEYIGQFPEEVKQKLAKLRSIIRGIVPEAEERMSYGMPSFHQNGPIVYYAGFKHHIGFYPTSSGIANFEDVLKAYRHSKGAVQFSIEEKLPASLIETIVAFKMKENLAKTKKLDR